MNLKHWILGGLASAGLLATTVSGQGIGAETRVSLRVEGRSLDEVVQYLREQSGANIVVVEGGEALVTMDLIDVPWREALDLAAEIAGCVIDERTAGVLAVDRPPRVDFAFENAPITEVIDTIAKLSGANIVVAPEVTGTLSLRLSNVPWRDALDVACKTLGFVIVSEGRGILRVVDPLSLQAQLETHSYQLRYVRPPGRYKPALDSEFVEKVGKAASAGGQQTAQIDEKKFPLLGALKKALSQGGDLDYIEEQNVIIVRDTAQVHRDIKEMIERLDLEPAQIYVDVKFVSTTNTDLFNLGVDYGDLGPQITASGGQIPITLPFDLGDGGWDDLIIASPSGDGPFADASLNAGGTVVPDTVFGALSFTGISATLRLLQRDQKSEVIQAPRLLLLDGREGTIFVGETVRYAEATTEQGQAGGLQLSVTEAKNSPVEVGFQLLVIPHVVPGANKLTMDIIPKETSLSGTGDGSIAPLGFDVFTVGASGLEGTIALPRKRSSTIVTSSLVESGRTIVLGGLTTDSHTETHQEIPYLADIPILGELFEHDEEATERRSLLVFVTPVIVRSSAEAERVLRLEIERRRGEYGNKLEELLGMTQPSEDAGSTAALAAEVEGGSR
jgi:type IV pilus assembly protein PilQ